VDEENKSADDFYSGTKAAISGGTTTILSVISPKKGESILDAIYEARRSYDAKVCCDYSLILKIESWTKTVKDEMKMLTEKHGISSFLISNLNDTELFEVFQFCKELEIVPLVHAENQNLSEKIYEKLLNEKVSPVEAFEISRNEQIEAEFIHRVCMIADMVEVPVYITKISGRLSAEQVSKAKRQNKFPVYGEILTSSIANVNVKKNRVCFASNPPIRSDQETSRSLIKHLALDEIQTIASNHCTFKTDQKEKFNLKGTGGCKERLLIAFEKSVHNGMIDLPKFVAVTSTNAAKIFNLFPKKGVIAVGSDADLVILNCDASTTISSKDQLVFNIFDGMKINGDIEHVISKFNLIFD
jgi:dihydropyrimidinase